MSTDQEPESFTHNQFKAYIAARRAMWHRIVAHCDAAAKEAVAVYFGGK